MQKQIKSFEQLLLTAKGYEVVILSGFPGSGKSYLAGKLADALDALVVSTDAVREALFSTIRFDLAGDEKINETAGDYYAEAYRRVAKRLEQEKRVVVDGTHAKQVSHSLIRELGENGVRVVVVRVLMDRAVATQRMKEKQGMANEKETYFEAWRRLMGYFDLRFETGEYAWPDEEMLGVPVVHYRNY